MKYGFGVCSVGKGLYFMAEKRVLLSGNLTITEAAHRLGISERTVYRWMKAGKLPGEILESQLSGLSDMSDNPDERCSSNLKSMSVMSDISSGISQEPFLLKSIEEKQAEIERLTKQLDHISTLVLSMQDQLLEMTRMVRDLQQRTSDLSDIRSETVQNSSFLGSLFGSKSNRKSSK